MYVEHNKLSIQKHVPPSQARGGVGKYSAIACQGLVHRKHEGSLLGIFPFSEMS